MTTKQKTKIHELFEFDKEAASKPPANSNISKFDFVIGTDEAGRGPGAGPVFAAAVCFPNVTEELFEKLSILNDSKQLSEKRREELFDIIKENSTYWIQEGSVEDIEKKNILNTSLECMRLSCSEVEKQLPDAKCLVLVDGNKKIKNYNTTQITVVKGDAKSAAIAAASILAKVARDRFMIKLSKEFPKYGWEKNKGYLTAAHIEAIKEYGATKWHRAKFLRGILPQQEEPASQLGLFL